MTPVGAIEDAYDRLEARGDALIAQLEERGHDLAGELRDWFEAFTGRLPAVVAEAKADARQVLHDAEVAAKPVIAEAVADARQIVKDAAEAFVPPPRSPE